MSFARKVWGAGSAASIVTFALVGCNSILDNERGVLATGDETPTEPGGEGGTSQLPPISGSEDGGTTKPPGDSGGGGRDAAGTDASTSDAGAACAVGEQRCHGVCVSMNDPLYGCGNPACTPCATVRATAACQGSVCVIAACDPGFADCNALPADGCETDLSKPATCGACNAVCPPTAPACAPSGASFACATGCPPTAPLLCGAECVDPMTSENHCGACNKPCDDVQNGTSECTAGACATTCDPGFHLCGATCAANTDPAACGAACAICPPAAGARPVCAAGACSFQCEEGFADCNKTPADGCEVTLATDPLNCGTCDETCQSGQCAGGACTPPP